MMVCIQDVVKLQVPVSKQLAQQNTYSAVYTYIYILYILRLCTMNVNS